MADTDTIFMDDNFSFGGAEPGMMESRRKSRDARGGGGSVKSTKSLYFTDPDASGTMARDEEVTLNIYDIYSDAPPSTTQGGGKISRSEVTSSSFKSTNSADVQINPSGRASHKKGRAPAPPPTYKTSDPPPTHKTSDPPPTHRTSDPPLTHKTTAPPPTHTTSASPPTHKTSAPPPTHTTSAPPPTPHNKKPAPPQPTKGSKQGAFQMKTSDGVQNKVPRNSSAGSLHDDGFKLALSNTLTRKHQSSEASVKSVSKTSVTTATARQNINGPDSAFSAQLMSNNNSATTPNLASTDHVQTSQAVSDRTAINGLSNGPLPDLDSGNGNDTSPGAGLKTSSNRVITTTHKTTKVTQSQSHAGGDVSVSGGRGNRTKNTGNEVSKHNAGSGYSAHQTKDITGNSSSGEMIIHETSRITESHSRNGPITNGHAIELDNQKIRPNKGGAPGKFQIRYKEGPEQGKVSKLDDRQVTQLSTASTRQTSTNEDFVSVSSTSSTLKSSAMRDEKFKASISGLMAGGKIPDASVSAPSSLSRQKKAKKFQATDIDIDIDEKSPRDPPRDEPMVTDEDFGSSTFPRGNKKDKGGVIASTPTSPYDELKETVKGGTVGTLVKDLFWNLPLTGRAIDPSTIERKRTQSSANKTPDTADPDEKKFKFLVEGIDTPDRPEDADKIAAELQEEMLRSKAKRPFGIPLGPMTPDPFPEKSRALSVTPPNTPELMDTDVNTVAPEYQSLESIDSRVDEVTPSDAPQYTEEVTSLKRMEKKGFSYIDRGLAQDVMKRAGDFTARKPHESVEQKVKMREAQNRSGGTRESLVIAEAKAKLQKNESVKKKNMSGANEPGSPEATLIAAKSKLQKQNSGNTDAPHANRELKTQKSAIESSMLLNAKSRLKSTSKAVVADDTRETVSDQNMSEDRAVYSVVNKAKHSVVKHDDISHKNTQHQIIKRDQVNDENKKSLATQATAKVQYQTKYTKVTQKAESKSGGKNVSAKHGGGDVGGNITESSSVVNRQRIDIHAPAAVVTTSKTDQVNKTNVNQGRVTADTSTTVAAFKSRYTTATSHVSPGSKVNKDAPTRSTAKVTEKVTSHEVTVGSGSVSPDFHSPKSIDPPDSAYYSDSKVSPNSEYKNGYKQITEETVVTSHEPREQEVTLAYTMTDGPSDKTNISQYSTKKDYSDGKMSTSNTTKVINSSTNMERYDINEHSLLTGTDHTESAMSSRREKTSKSVVGDTSKSKTAIRSLREVKKAAQRMKAVDIEYDLNEPLRVSQRDLRNASLSQSIDKDDDTTYQNDVTVTTHDVTANKNDVTLYKDDVTVHTKETRSLGENDNHSSVTKGNRGMNIDLVPNTRGQPPAPVTTSLSSSESEAPTPTPEHGNIYIDIPIQGISSSSEIRSERVTRSHVENGRGGRRQRADIGRRQRADSGSGISFASSTGHYRRHNQRDVPITVETHYNGQSYPMYSPGASSTQTDNTYSSASVPMVSPSISGGSSISTTAQDTFEYSKAYKQNQHRQDRRTMDRNPLQPLTININAPEHIHRERVTRHTGGRSRSETRAHQSDYRAAEAAPIVNHEPGMFRMSQMSGHEMTSARHGQRQHSAQHSGVHATYDQRLSHGTASSLQGRDPFRMRPREESFNSQSSGPLSPPGRYLRVDENRGGRLPIYGRRGRSIKAIETNEYSQQSSHHRRTQQAHVSRVHVDDGYDHGDANSALSEPAYGAASGKYSVNRMMEKRGLRSGQPIHPDMQQQQQQSRKRRVYQVTGATMSTGGTRTLNATNNTSKVRSPDVQAVDPDLVDADKRGDKYNITLKLNAMGGISSRPGSRHDERYEEQLNSLNNNTASRYESHYDNEQTTFNYRDMTQRSNSHGQYDRDLSPTDSTLRQMTLVKLKDPSVPEGNMQGQYSTKARFKVRHDAPEVMIHGQSVNTEREYMVKSMTGTDRRNVASTDVSSLNSPARGSEAPRFTMTVNQTMTMDYVAPTDEEGEGEALQHAPERPPRRKKQNQPQDEDSDYFRNVRVEEWDERQTRAPPHDGERKPRKKGRKKMTDDDDLEYYMSPAEDHDDNYDDGDIPQVVRGSILIKNAIDTTGAPKVIDVVEGDDSDDEVIVEDNVNMFHGAYFQSRENPMYSSDPDLSGTKNKTRKRPDPQFTQLFDSNEKYREIKVNRGE